jgi:hypothetical protein
MDVSKKHAAYISRAEDQAKQEISMKQVANNIFMFIANAKYYITKDCLQKYILGKLSYISPFCKFL